MSLRQRQVKIIDCSILTPNQPVPVSILDGVRRIDVYESIFQNTISGSIAVTDKAGLVELLPIVGVEHLFLDFAIDGTNTRFRRVFRITKVHDQVFLRNDLRDFIIEFATPEFVASTSRRICHRFHDITCADAVKTIVNQYLGTTDETKQFTSKFVPGSPEPTWGKIDVVIPNYTPLRAINYFAMLSLRNENRQSGGYLFFETLDGFHFSSLHRLIEHGKTQAQQLPVLHVNLTQSSSSENTDNARNAIFRFQQEHAFDLLGGIASGMYRSRMIHFDFLAQKINAHKLSVTDSLYTDAFKDTASSHLNTYPLYPENYDREIGPSVQQFMVPTNVWSTANTSTPAGQKAFQQEQLMHESIIHRNRQLRELRQIESLVELPGQPQIRAGSVVRVIYPMTNALAGADGTDTTQSVRPTARTTAHSGNHMVSSVHHIMVIKTPGEFDYRMALRVNNDSLSVPMRGL